MPTPQRRPTASFNGSVANVGAFCNRLPVTGSAMDATNFAQLLAPVIDWTQQVALNDEQLWPLNDGLVAALMV